MHDLTKCDRDYHNLRADLMELRDWAEHHMLGDPSGSAIDWQHIAKHMTALLDALIVTQTPPR